jgi:hypothetical protein
MIIWLNGPFGAGKTTTTTQLVDRLPRSVAFDPELVGEAIVPALSAVRPVPDFQDWEPWREIVVAALVSLDRYADRPIVTPQTVVVEEYWDELTGGLRAAGIEVRAFTLHCEPAEHERRIAHDTTVRSGPTGGWRR